MTSRGVRELATFVWLSFWPGWLAAQAERIDIAKAPHEMAPGETRHFRVLTAGHERRLQWSVKPNLGAMSADGTYSAPVSVDNGQVVLITVTDIDDPRVSRTLRITLLAADSPIGQLTFKPADFHRKDAVQEVQISVPVRRSEQVDRVVAQCVDGADEAACEVGEMHEERLGPAADGQHSIWSLVAKIPADKVGFVRLRALATLRNSERLRSETADLPIWWDTEVNAKNDLRWDCAYPRLLWERPDGAARKEILYKAPALSGPWSVIQIYDHGNDPAELPTRGSEEYAGIGSERAYYKIEGNNILDIPGN